MFFWWALKKSIQFFVAMLIVHYCLQPRIVCIEAGKEPSLKQFDLASLSIIMISKNDPILFT